MDKQDKQSTHFGYKHVRVSEKAGLVGAVFDRVAGRYDVMNDVMSFGLHRLWKSIAVSQLAVRPHHKVLDIAGGTGDLTRRIAPLLGDDGCVMIADINATMLASGRDKLMNAGVVRGVDYIQADAQALPFCGDFFDRIMIAFGLRNVTDPAQALRAMYRVLKPGGRCIVLEFSKPVLPLLDTVYDGYSFHILPRLGQLIAHDAESYRYLAESIRMHPDQETLLRMMQEAGFERCRYSNMAGGIVALHVGHKL